MSAPPLPPVEALLDETRGPFVRNTVVSVDVEFWCNGARMNMTTAELDLVYQRLAHELHGRFGCPNWPALEIMFKNPNVLVSFFRGASEASLKGINGYILEPRTTIAVVEAIMSEVLARVFRRPMCVRFRNMTVKVMLLTVEMPCNVDIDNPWLYSGLGALRERSIRLKQKTFDPTAPDGTDAFVALFGAHGRFPITNLKTLEGAVLATERAVRAIYPCCTARPKSDGAAAADQ